MSFLKRPFLVLLCLPLLAANAQLPAPPAAASLRVGSKLTVGGQPFFVVRRLDDGQYLITPPVPPTQSLGAFIQPVGAVSDPPGTGRPLAAMIDGSGWGEWFPGSGVYVHTNDVGAGGASMWNYKQPRIRLTFDLGRAYRVGGLYLWNYNETGSWTARSVKDFSVAASLDNHAFTPVGEFTARRAPGTPDDRGQSIAFAAPVQARWLSLDLKSNYDGDEFGLAEIRFADADTPAPLPTASQPAKYPRPTHPTLQPGQALPGAENRIYPAGAGVVDVTQPPYNARGNGVADDTRAIQQAIDDHPNQGAIIYLPNGVYLVSRTLRWSGGDDPFAGGAQKQIVLQGQSRAGTVIQLRNACSGFDNPRETRAVIWTGRAPAQRFGNEVCNLTVDTGVGNPGATGLQFIANNQGGVREVDVVSGDGEGVAGLDLGYTDEQGPCFIKDVRVQGFDVGVKTAHAVASVTMEDVTLEDQNVAGLENGGQPLSVRHLHSHGAVTGVRNTGGLLVLIDSVLEGTKVPASAPAVANAASILLRNVQTPGYKVAVAEQDGRQLAGPSVAEYRFPQPTRLSARESTTLGLPVKEMPVLPDDDPATWATPQRFGARADGSQDDADAIQRAIDSGATTVFLPRGRYRVDKTIVLRGAVRRLIGGKPWFLLSNQRTKDDFLFRVEDGIAPVVSIERINTEYDGALSFVEHASRRTLVLRGIMDNFRDGEVYRGTGGGDVFIEDVVGTRFSFKNQRVWARQLNPEGFGTHVLNDGGQVWVLGLKVETGGTVVETRHGGATEILGGLSQTNNGKAAPMFINDRSNVSVTFAEVNNSDDPFRQFVVERGAASGQTWGNPDASFRGFRPVFYEGRNATEVYP